MDRGKLIARQTYGSVIYRTLMQFPVLSGRVTPFHAEECASALAALSSRPSPTEERILAAAKAAWRADMIDAADQRGHPIHDGFDFEWGWKELANMPLSGPGFVRQWTTIAKAALATDTTPSRDEEGSVDREAIARVRENAFAPLGSPIPEARVSLLARAVRHSLRSYGHRSAESSLPECIASDVEAALKTSTPETQTVEGGGQ